jgi:transmembrane 9 superfamily protein 1
MALLGMFNVHRHHAMNSTAILLYAFTSSIAGYVSAYLFKNIGGHNWVWNIVLTSSFFALPFFCVWSFVNTVAWIHQSTQALPFTTIVLLMCVWLMGESFLQPPSLPSHSLLPPVYAVGFPLTVLGGIVGKNTASGFDAPCRTKNIAREIPASPWYRSAFIHMAIGGFLPFR